MSEVALFFGLSSQRLRARCRWGGAALALSLVLPYEVIDGVPQFVWQLAPELPPAGVVAAFAPTAAGLSLLAASRFVRRATTLAVWTVAALALAALVIQLGADAAAWEVLPLPTSLTDRPTPTLLALALTAAGASLMFRPRARKVGRAVLAAALASAALFYAWPARGEAPIAAIARALTTLPDLPGWRFRIGHAMVALVALWPLIIALAGLRFATRPPAREQPMLGALALYGLPGILLMFLYRALLGAQGGVGVVASVLALVILTALLALIASAVEVLGEAWATPDADEAELEQAPGLPLRRAAAVAAGVVVAIGGAQWLASRPPVKGVAWTLAPATPEGDKLFGERIHAWSDARLRWDQRVRAESGASALVEAKAAARELVSAARALDAGLGAAVETLTREAGALDLGGRRWYRLIGDVNEASRRAGLPYYVDPTVNLFQTPDGLRRHFFAHSYRIEKVRRFLVAGEEMATLQVRQIGHRRDGHQRLGFSRDLQPFALVVVDELGPFAEETRERGRASPPRCTEKEEADPGEALVKCGEILGQGVAAAGGPERVLVALTESTERHELQHQVDGPHLEVAGLVLKRLAAYAEEPQRRVNRELSAYVAEMTGPGSAPRLSLAHLARFALLGDRGTEHHVAVLAMEALTGRETRGPAGVDRAALGQALGELAAESDDALRARAAKAWKDLFGRALPEARPLE